MMASAMVLMCFSSVIICKFSAEDDEPFCDVLHVQQCNLMTWKTLIGLLIDVMITVLNSKSQSRF